MEPKFHPRVASFTVGSYVTVRAGEEANFLSEYASKLKGRTGIVTSQQEQSIYVAFHSIGRRKEHRQSFTNPDSTLDILTDQVVIDAYLQEVQATKARSDARIAAKRAEAKP